MTQNQLSWVVKSADPIARGLKLLSKQLIKPIDILKQVGKEARKGRVCSVVGGCEPRFRDLIVLDAKPQFLKAGRQYMIASQVVEELIKRGTHGLKKVPVLFQFLV